MFRSNKIQREYFNLLLDYLSEGKIDELFQVSKSGDQEDFINNKMGKIADTWSQYIYVLNGIAEGDFNRKIPLNTKENLIESVISKVVDSVTTTSKVASDIKIALENERNKLIQEDWMKSEYATIFSKIQGVKTLTDLGNIILNEMAFAVQALIGALYIKNPENGNNRTELDLVATYGILPKAKKEKFQMGEGIIGQCAFDLRPRFFNLIPENLITIESGITKVKSKFFIVTPIVYEGEAYGVLELGSLSEFSEIQKKLITQITENIGISIKNISGNMLMEKLVKEIAESNNSLASQKQALDSAAIVAETDVHGKITYVNDKFLEISKYRRDELLGQDHRILNSGYHPKEFFINLWKTIVRGEVWSGEVKNKAKDGSYYWVDTTIYPVKGINGRPNKYVVIRFDVSDKKRVLEELQLATKEANKAAKIKTEFLANMSHEIRTPMNAIIGMGELLKETPLNEDQQRYVNILSSAGSVLLDVINNILDLSKAEAEIMNVENIPFNLEEVVHDTAQIMSKSAHKKNLELIISVQPDVKTNLIGDPGHLRQVLINLLTNAIKFTKVGEVILRIENDQTQNGWLYFSVTDTGIGIPSEDFEKVFTSFYQANSSTKKEFGGTGLGLTISKKIIESLGGKIDFTSTFGQGSTFYFSIPIKEQDPETQLVGEKNNLNDLKVLVVDDNKAHRQVLKEMTEYWGMNAVESTSGPLALKIITEAQQNQQPFDLIILDQHMPGMSGIEVRENLEKMTKNIPRTIIMLTSEDRYGNLNNNPSLNAPNYIIKPIQRYELHKTIVKSLLLETEKPSVLLVEDEPEIQEMMSSMIQPLNVNIFQARNGKEALNYLKSNRVHLVLSDIKMPEMDGISFWKEFKKLSIPSQFIFISGFPQELNSDLSNVVMLSKPFDPNTFLRTINDSLKSNVVSLSSKREPVLSLGEEIKPMKMLLVDDVRDNIELIQLYLKKYPIKLDTALSGQEAINKFTLNKYDLILMDIQMPIMDGHETIKRMRKHEVDHNLPPTVIVTLSAHAVKEEKENSFLSGSNGYLTKPIKKKELLKAISFFGNNNSPESKQTPTA